MLKSVTSDDVHLQLSLGLVRVQNKQVARGLIVNITRCLVCLNGTAETSLQAFRGPTGILPVAVVSDNSQHGMARVRKSVCVYSNGVKKISKIKMPEMSNIWVRLQLLIFFFKFMVQSLTSFYNKEDFLILP